MVTGRVRAGGQDDAGPRPWQCGATLRPSFGIADATVALFLVVAAAAYLTSLPRNLGLADESYFLYEAKRIRDGQVMYRDIFQYTTPLSSYFMAALFWLFGTTMATARISMALVHTLTGLVLYATARRLAVRLEVAVLVPLAYLAICQPIWPYASWHWFSTLATAALLFALITTPWRERPRWALLPGLLSGVLIGVQHQRGLVVTAGAFVVLVADHLAGRRYSREPVTLLLLRFAYLAGGVLLVVVPLLVGFVAAAGAGPLYDALVRFPLESYHRSYRVPWGQLSPLARGYGVYTFPAVLRYSPLLLALPAAEIAVDLVRRLNRQRVGHLLALVVVGASSLLSIWYYPDLIHFAFVACVFWLCAAIGMEWILSVLPGSPRLRRAAGLGASAVVLVSLVRHLDGNARLLQEQFPLSHETAFGRIDFAAPWQIAFVDRVRELLAQAPSAELFCYPNLAAPYLTTGGSNPTPFQHFDAGVFPRRYTAAVLATLTSRRVPYVVASPLIQRDDPIIRLLNEDYENVPVAGPHGELPSLWLFGRKDRSLPKGLGASDGSVLRQ